MAIQFFKEEGRGYAPKVSVRKHGQIGLNQGATIRYNIRDGQFALLGYDKDEQIIAIKFVEEDEEGAKRVTVRSKNASISAKSFLDYFNIPYKETNSYELEERKLENNEKLLIFYIT